MSVSNKRLVSSLKAHRLQSIWYHRQLEIMTMPSTTPAYKDYLYSSWEPEGPAYPTFEPRPTPVHWTRRLLRGALKWCIACMLVLSLYYIPGAVILLAAVWVAWKILRFALYLLAELIETAFPPCRCHRQEHHHR